MAWEVYTLGGGTYLWEVFNAIAALTTGKNYLSIIAITAMFGMTWAMLQASVSSTFKPNLTWIISFMLFYNVMFAPKATVIIHDPLNRAALYDRVDNVPFALAVFASFSSRIGKELTEKMEMSFSPPDYLPYHEHGMLFGSKLINITSSMKITDENFASSINSFMKQCVFYDLLLHRYSINDLKQTDDIWRFLTIDNQPSQARSFELVEDGQRSIKTCNAGALILNERWKQQLSTTPNIVSQLLFPDTNQNQAKVLFLQHLPTAYASLKHTSQNASEIIKQNLLINAIDRAGADFSNTGSATNIYTTVRASVQTKAAFNASKRQAEEWVPILRIVFEVLFYGAFPLVFLMFLLPIGPQVAQGYFTTFIWLQAWGPLYAILNLVMSKVANYKTAALSNYGLSIISQAGIQAIHQDVAEIAGYISWFIPFIAAGLAKGTIAVTGLSTSMLAIPQSAANHAANEAATGNISLGNLNLDNMSYGNVSANKVNGSAFFDDARVQSLNNAGGITTINPDGRAVYDQTSSVSRIPNIQLTNNNSLAESTSQTASVYQSMGENLALQASHSKAKSVDQLAQFMASHSINENNGMRFTEHASAEVRESYGKLESAANELARTKQIDKTTALGLVLGGSVGYGKGSGSGINSSSNVSANAYNDARSAFVNSEVERVSQSHQLDKHRSIVLNAIKDRSLELSDSSGRSLNESFNQNFSESDRLENQSRAYFDKAASLNQQAQIMQTNSLSYSQDKMPEFIEYAKNYRGLNGMPLGERALEVLASDPQAANVIKESFLRSNNSYQQLNNSFNENAAGIGVRNITTQYHETAQNIQDNVGQFDSTRATKLFEYTTHGRKIDNSTLQSQIPEYITNQTSEISNKVIDKANVADEINEKLEHHATITMLNSAKEFLNITESKKPASNFDNKEE